jgi:hypothetical protein
MTARTIRNHRKLRVTALIVTSALLPAVRSALAADPPLDLLKQVAQRESASAAARANFTYRQSVTVQEFDHRDLITGKYSEVRDVTFSPTGARYEQVVQKPQSTLARIRLTPEDFEDIRNIQPFFLTTDTVHWYRGTFKGEQQMDGFQCFVVSVSPKQILSGQRYFEGTLWVRETDFGVVRTEGQAVPQIETLSQQNLFPHFTTIRKVIDGNFFPVETYADDTLYFRDWPQRIRIQIHYLNYQHFGTNSTLSFQQPATSPAPPQAPH